jgi:hypothetical protein
VKRHEATEPIYGTRVLFLLGGKSSEAAQAAQKWMFRKEPFDDARDDRGCSYRDDNGHFAIWLRCASDISTLAHEAAHVGIWLMERIGLTINSETDEAFAYYVDWLVREGMRR